MSRSAARTLLKGLLSGFRFWGDFIKQAEASNFVAFYHQSETTSDQDWKVALLDDLNPFPISVELHYRGAQQVYLNRQSEYHPEHVVDHRHESGIAGRRKSPLHLCVGCIITCDITVVSVLSLDFADSQILYLILCCLACFIASLASSVHGAPSSITTLDFFSVQFRYCFLSMHIAEHIRCECRAKKYSHKFGGNMAELKVTYFSTL